MLNKIKNLFNKKKEKKYTMGEITSSHEVGDWYQDISGQLSRLSNIYQKNKEVFITIERILRAFDEWEISKQDFLRPDFLFGTRKLNKETCEKLEISYWKLIESELESKNQLNKKQVDDFIKFGEKQ